MRRIAQQKKRQWEAAQNGDGVGTIEVKPILPKKNLITLVGIGFVIKLQREQRQ